MLTVKKETMKTLKLSVAMAAVLAIVFFACQKDLKQTDSQTQAARPQPTKEALDPLSLSCAAVSGAAIDVTVCAGNSRAPAGFSSQWETLADYNL